MSDIELIRRLEDIAIEVRKGILKISNHIGSCHIGGPLSATDMVVALYNHYMRYDPKDYEMPNRDRFFLSKGHNAVLMYSVFSNLGMYPLEEVYSEYNKVGGRFGMHPHRLYLPMFEFSTGSLGHGLSVAFGNALAARADGKDIRHFCMVGDAELHEGSNWEAIMSIASYELGNVILIVDNNKIGASRPVEEEVVLDSLEEKFKAFDWDVRSIDGNNMEEIVQTLEELSDRDSSIRRKPLVIISNTVKGKGIGYMENTAKWHIGGLDKEKLAEAFEELDSKKKVRG